MDTDPDVITKTKKFLDSHDSLANRLTQNEKAELTHWLQNEIIFERQGWKGKLDAALRQSEAHRKAALSWEAMATARKEVFEEERSFVFDEEKSEEMEKIKKLEEQLAKERQAFKKQKEDFKRQTESLKKRLNGMEETNQVLIRDKRLCMTLLKVEVPEKKAEINRILRHYMNQSEQKLKQCQQYENANDQQLYEMSVELDYARKEKADLVQENLEMREAIHGLENSGKIGNGMTVLAYQDRQTMHQQRQIRIQKTMEDMKLILHERAHQIYTQTETIEKLSQSISALEEQMHDKDKLISKYEKQIQTIKHQMAYGSSALNASSSTAPNTTRNGQELPLLVPLGRGDRHDEQYSSMPSLSLTSNMAITKAARKSLPHASNGRMKAFSPAKTAVTRCFRCNQLYRLMDNNKFACRYHSKSKRKVEKYSASGKIVDIAYVWSCCDKALTADGCCKSQHV